MAEDAANSHTAASSEAASLDFPMALVTWCSNLEAYLAAIRAYMNESDEAGRRALTMRWTTTWRLIGDAERLIEEVARLTGAAEPRSLADKMKASDAAEGASRTLDVVAETALDPSVLVAALSGMSRTYSDRLRGLGREVREAERLVKGGRAAAALAAAAATLPFEVGVITAAYGDGRGGVATELYISALRCRAGPEALALLEAAKSAALGVAADTPAAAAADAAALAEYHPLQAMTYTPAAWGPARVEPALAATNLGLPQARLSVVYDLEPLIDRRRALAHGPLASMSTGLNYRLVERLRTIRALKLSTPAKGPWTCGPRQEDARAGALQITTDGVTVRDLALQVTTNGVTVREIDAGATACEEIWAPFAGSRPCVEAHAGASAAIILAGVREGRGQGWGLGLRERYEAAIRGELIPGGECPEGALVGALVVEFERAYERAAPPASLDDYRSLVAPAKPGPGDYLCAAAAHLGISALDERLRMLHVKPGPVPHADIVREARVAQVIQAVDTGRKLWLRVKEAFIMGVPDLQVFTLPASQRKNALVAAFRRIATVAAQAGPVDCMPPTLRLFAATAPRLN